MNILINCSNLKKGGGLQVGDSICRCLNNFQKNHYVVVLSSYMDETAIKIKTYDNVTVVRYDIRNNLRTLLLARDKVLDNLVRDFNVSVVFTIFGPSRWVPRCKHLCGFARAQLLMVNSPYFSYMPWIKRLKKYLIYKIWYISFRRCANTFYTENPLVSKMLEKKIKKAKIYTVTNYYNQVFDQPNNWKKLYLKPFNGIRLLSVTSAAESKNLKIAYEAAKILIEKYPYFNFRFVMTIKEEKFIHIDNDMKDYFEFIGPVPISAVPFLYKQCDIMFQPSLLECFTATYPEAMRMGIPIITTDLDFAKGLCGNAARYYSAIDARDCAQAIYDVATNNTLRNHLIESGKKQLNKYDNYNIRAKKLIEILEKL